MRFLVIVNVMVRATVGFEQYIEKSCEYVINAIHPEDFLDELKKVKETSAHDYTNNHIMINKKCITTINQVMPLL